jgi:hypothetical protein
MAIDTTTTPGANPESSTQGDVPEIDLNHPAVKALIERETQGLLKKRDELLKKAQTQQSMLSAYEGIDPKVARDALKKMQELEEKKMLDAGQIDDLVNHKTERMRLDLEGKVQNALAAQKAAEEEKNKLRKELQTTRLTNGIWNAALNTGVVRKDAKDYILFKANQVWQFDEGQDPVARKPDGNLIFSKDGHSPISMEEWVMTLKETDPFCFETPTLSGTGMRPSTGTGGRPIKITRQDAKNYRILTAAMEQAKAQGVEVEVVD